jgi:acetyl-CoA synthetase
MPEKNLEALLQEDRLFYPSSDFQGGAIIQNTSVYEIGQDRLAFWESQAEQLTWFEPWKKTLEWNPPFAKWFLEGKLNASANCLDRHLTDWHRNKAALIFEGENGDSQVLTYQDLHREVSKLANVLKKQGVQKGDRVTIYLPMIPEAVISMLACARIGAPHSVVFGGFSSEALRDRVIDAQAKVVITADGGFRRGNIVPLKENADLALNEVDCVEHIIVVERTKQDITMKEGRDLWYHEEMKKASPARPSASCPRRSP